MHAAALLFRARVILGHFARAAYRPFNTERAYKRAPSNILLALILKSRVPSNDRET